MISLDYIDSHTGGEPTRLITGGLPDLDTDDPAEALKILATKHDWVRKASILEPRGSDVLVGAALLPSHRGSADAAVVFFNTVGYLGMCGHGTIGVVASLAYLGYIKPGPVTIDTPPGRVKAHLHEDGAVSFENVPSYRFDSCVGVRVEGIGLVMGDIAYGGNWFFLVRNFEGKIEPEHIPQLTPYAYAVRQALFKNGIRGRGHAEIDHVELFCDTPNADSRNFVLCPGLAYDRSPCGTGTSAKLACLYADGKLKEGQIWRQESVIGSIFEGSVRIKDGQIVPTIKGQAWITAQGKMLIDETDPYRFGIPAEIP